MVEEKEGELMDMEKSYEVKLSKMKEELELRLRVDIHELE